MSISSRRPATETASYTWNTPTGATMSILNRNCTWSGLVSDWPRLGPSRNGGDVAEVPTYR
jgi:hypothetical protein